MSPLAVLLFLFFAIVQAALFPYGEGFHRIARGDSDDSMGYLDSQADPIPMRNIRYYRTGGTILLG